MKKIIALLLCLTMVCSLFACSGETANKDNEQPDAQTEQTEQEEQTEQSEEAEQTEATVYSESIPLGGNAGDYALEGPAYGNYTELTDIDEFLYEDCTYTHVYADETCDTPYIAVYRWAKDGMTLEETAKSLAEYWNGGYYEIVDGADWEAKADKLAYLCYSYEENGQYFYIDTMLFEDGDEFVNIDAYAKSVEVQIADTNTYMWVPAGYTDAMRDDLKTYGGFFYGKYDDSYYFPEIWMTKANFSYEYLTWDWGSVYTDGLPFTEEEYDAFLASISDSESHWGEEKNTEFYKMFGCDVQYYEQNYYNGFDTSLIGMIYGDYCYTDIFFVVDGEWYEIWTTTDELKGMPYIGTSLLKSLHTKGESEVKVYENAIPLGGTAGEYKIEGPAYGKYTEMADPSDFSDGSSEVHVYVDETCDTPYIAVYRWAKDGQTLEEAAQSEADLYSNGYYEKVTSGDWEVSSDNIAFFCSETAGEGYYFYCDSVMFEDGDDFVEVVSFGKSVEVQIADTDTYMWVPAGYTDLMDDDEKAHNAFFCGTYDISYWNPTIWAGELGTSYEYLTWFYSDYYDELPISEEKYNEICNATEDVIWNEDECKEFYGYFGGEVVYFAKTDYNGYSGQKVVLTFTDSETSTLETDITVKIGEKYYQIWTVTENTEGLPYISTSLLKSLHTK